MACQIAAGKELDKKKFDVGPNLFEHWLQLYKEAGGEKFGSSARRRFFSICNSYMDILHSNKKPFYNGDRGEDEIKATDVDVIPKIPLF